MSVPLGMYRYCMHGTVAGMPSSHATGPGSNRVRYMWTLQQRYAPIFRFHTFTAQMSGSVVRGSPKLQGP